MIWIILIFLWMVGALFTVGFTTAVRPNINFLEIFSYMLVWPMFLGRAVYLKWGGYDYDADGR